MNIGTIIGVFMGIILEIHSLALPQAPVRCGVVLQIMILFRVPSMVVVVLCWEPFRGPES